MRIGILDVGGGYRDVYGAGVFDCFMDEGIAFDIAFGISAGSANLASFLAGQRGRNLRFFTEHGFSRKHPSLSDIVNKEAFVDLSWIYDTLSRSGGKDPWDFRKAMANSAEFYVLASEAGEGKPVWFGKDDMVEDDYSIFKASSAIPGVCNPIEIDGKAYFDGGLADPIPFKDAFKMGADKLVVILTLPLSSRKKEGQKALVAKKMGRKHPGAARMLRENTALYNSEAEELLKLQAEGKCIVIAPTDCHGVHSLTRDKEKLLKLYHSGYEDAKNAIPSIKGLRG